MDDSGDYDANDETSSEDKTDSDIDNNISQFTARKEILRPRTTKHTSNDDHQTAKWQRLRSRYSDQYLELFNATYADVTDDNSLEESQFGSVLWTAAEKSTFFTALSRKGRHDLAGISAALQTKSEVEVKDYLDRLKSAHIERQMFAALAKHVSQAQMESAVEVGEECEFMLENAADALAAYQECFDRASARQKSDELRLIDIDTAEKLDTQSNEKENEQRSDDEISEDPSDRRTSHKMFHLSNFLELSRRLFMNASPENEYMHWTQLAEVDESPSIAIEVIDMFYELVVSLVRRILQSAIFLAQSRIRATTTSVYIPAQVLHETDVEAALNVLNMPLDAFDYWVGWVKRSKVNVVGGSNRKGQSDRNKLSFRQIEEILSIRATRGRHRSLSNLISMTSAEGSTTGDSDSEGVSLQSRDEKIPEEDGEMDLLTPAGYSTGPNDTDSEEPLEVENFDAHARFDKASFPSESAEDQYISRKRRLEMLEDEHDEYVERLDQARRQREEAHLRQLLGHANIKSESLEDPGWHPNTRRKTQEELHDWSEIPYRADWEEFVPSQSADKNMSN